MNATTEIFSFLRDLAANNNRVWFAENKHRYLLAKENFENVVSELIKQISLFDNAVRTVSPKDCIFRIYRDTRFHDKDTPYKIHFGAYIAPNGGRKSEYGGYYIHLQPGDNSFLSPGIWSPEPNMLKELRRAIFENYDEFKEIVERKEFSKYFRDSFYEQDMLKKLPAGYSKDFEGAYYLKLKHFLVSASLADNFFENEHWLGLTLEMFKSAYPLNHFLNYTVEELKGV